MCLCSIVLAVCSSVQTVKEGVEWISLEYFRDIEKGSALDFSQTVPRETPAGKFGWLRSVNGHAEFERRPGVPARFYGVNLCNSANYLSDDEIERVADRLVRLGYNAVRIHHHDNAWAKEEKSRDRLDALMAACIRRGIYLTTDLFVSRRCTWRELGEDRDGDADMMTAKLLVMCRRKAYENWKGYARAFLTHVNPYTGRSLAEEPAMPFLVLVNESSSHSDWNKAKGIPELRALWPKWLAEARAENPKAFPTASPDEFPEKGGWWDPSPENGAKAAFWAWCCERFSRHAAAFLRDELNVKALVSTENNGPTLPVILRMRAAVGDYVDFHYYTEHAAPASKAAREETGLPLNSVFRNHNPLCDPRGMYRDVAFNRVWGRPLVVSESQMGGPNFNRAMGGLLTGAFAAVQDWTGLWTFAYAHQREKMFDGVDAAPGRFDLSLDPLLQATDRLPTLLFLRGDQATPCAAFANHFSGAAMRDDSEGRLSLPSRPGWAGRGLEWRARLGVSFDGVAAPGGVVKVPAESEGKPPAGVPPCGIVVDGERGSMSLAGERTCAGFSGRGEEIGAGALEARLGGSPALVAAASLDSSPLARSPRILVWHLTDLHGEGFSWGGDVVKSSYWRQTGILDWGSSRLMLRAGEADVSLAIDNAAKFRVYALDTAGRRRAEVPCRAEGGRLRFTASSRQPFGGCMYYEVAME